MIYTTRYMCQNSWNTLPTRSYGIDISMCSNPVVNLSTIGRTEYTEFSYVNLSNRIFIFYRRPTITLAWLPGQSCIAPKHRDAICMGVTQSPSDASMKRNINQASVKLKQIILHIPRSVKTDIFH